MRSYTYVVGLLASATVLSGCSDLFSPDNFDEPTSRLTGSVTYQGQPIPVASEEVELDVWQPGYDFEEDIDVFVDQDGTFSAILFDGSYEISLINGQGPWVDSNARMPFTVSGSTTIEVPVTPYYLVANPSISVSGNVATATFTINSVNTTKAIDYVGLYVSTTLFVDRTNQVAFVEVDADDVPDLNGTITLTLDLPSDIRVTPSPAPRTRVYARVGVGIVGESDQAYSPVQDVGL